MTTHRSGTLRTAPPRTGPPTAAGATPFAEARRAQSARAQRRFGSPRFWRVAHLATLVLGPVVLLSLLAAIVGYVRLLHGPVSLNMFTERIERSINADLDGFTARIDDAQLTLGDNHAVELRLTNLRVSEADGDLVASAPLAAVELNKAALWGLEAAPERVYLIEPTFAVVYTEGQGFSLSIADAAPAAPDGTHADAPIVPPRPTPAERPAKAAPDAGSLPPSFHRIDLARLIAETSAHARRGRAATSRLRELGVRNAMVSVTYGGRTSEIVVAEGSVDLEHMKRRSVISGTATMVSAKGPWSLTFRTEDSDRQDLVKVTTTVQDFVPSTLSRVSPGLDLFDMLDTPMSGELALDLSSAGDLRSANLSLDVGHGFIRLPSLSNTPLLIDGGRLALLYDAGTRRLSIAPSSLDWGGSRITVEGAVSSDPAATGEPEWHFGLQSIEGVLSAEEFGVAPVPIESFKAAGRIIPGEGLLQLSELSLRAGGGEVMVNGEIVSGHGSPSTRVEAALTPMPLATLKAMWPRAAAPTARAWVGSRVHKANLKSASFKLLSGRFLETGPAPEGTRPAAGQERLSASIAIGDLSMRPLPDSLPIEAPQALIRLENSSLEVTVPGADIIAGPTQRLPLKGVRLTVVDVTHEAPVAELAFTSETTVPALIEALNHSQLHLAGQGPLPFEGINGKVDGELKISMPLIAGARVTKAEGKARVTDLKGKNKEHQIDLQGGTIDIDVSDIGVIAKGDMIVNGVLAKLHMHRILDAPPEMQPPIRISATVDNADRTQFGLDVNHLVQGEMAVELTIAHKPDAPASIHVRGDLTNAELLFEEVAWRKAPGRQASVEFDVEMPAPDSVHLKNFKLIGDMIAIDGWVTVDQKREVREFAFPNFSVNVVSRLDVRGKLDSKKIWKIAVKGPTFDAKDLFRSLIVLGTTTEAEVKPLQPAAGVDLTAEIDTVLGHGDVSLRGYKLKVSERKDQFVSIEGHGTLDGGKPFSIAMKADGPRKLYAESTDAGQTFKLIGFYPNIQGGHMRLEVDLEGRGAAEKSGVLWVDDFRVLGDPIISEVYSSAESSPGEGAPGSRKRKVEREVFEFQRMKVPFSLGHGQFVLDDSYLRGPLLGASIRGKVDYNAQRINLGGTYVPLQGINAAVCDIPLFGPIVAGFDCQGVFGITYAIQGPLAQPQVLVNPLSMFTPGILRGIMEMTSPNPQVQAPLSDRKRAPVEERVRASSSAPSSVDGWSSETMPGDGKKQGGAKKK